jgi:hypothetical protein
MGCAHAASANEVATDDAASMEVIEMLGETDDEMTDLEIAMSDEDLNEKPVEQEVKNAE